MTVGLSVGRAISTQDARVDVAELIEGIGTNDFGRRLVGLLHRVCGANHFVAFQLGLDFINPLAFSSIDFPGVHSTQVDRYVSEGWWKKDPLISGAKQCIQQSATGLIRVNLDHSGDAELKREIYPHVCDAVMVCGRRGEALFGLSVLSADPRPEFATGALDQLNQLAGTLVSAMAKHSTFIAQLPDAAKALTDLVEIENCFLARSALPKRELEVCARILYGMSTVGISLDLGIGEESVKTYRKRSYQRMGIGSERELLQWYLAQWSHWQRDRVRWISPTRSGSKLH